MASGYYTASHALLGTAAPRTFTLLRNPLGPKVVFRAMAGLWHLRIKVLPFTVAQGRIQEAVSPCKPASLGHGDKAGLGPAP